MRDTPAENREVVKFFLEGRGQHVWFYVGQRHVFPRLLRVTKVIGSVENMALSRSRNVRDDKEREGERDTEPIFVLFFSSLSFPSQISLSFSLHVPPISRIFLAFDYLLPGCGWALGLAERSDEQGLADIHSRRRLDILIELNVRPPQERRDRRADGEKKGKRGTQAEKNARDGHRK